MSPYEQFNTHVYVPPKHRGDTTRAPRSRKYEPRHSTDRPRPAGDSRQEKTA